MKPQLLYTIRRRISWAAARRDSLSPGKAQTPSRQILTSPLEPKPTPNPKHSAACKPPAEALISLRSLNSSSKSKFSSKSNTHSCWSLNFFRSRSLISSSEFELPSELYTVPFTIHILVTLLDKRDAFEIFSVMVRTSTLALKIF